MAVYLTPRPPRRLIIRGIAIQILADAASTGGLYGMIETTVPRGIGPPPHRHSREDETFYVVAGEAEFRLGDDTTVCGAGSIIYGPRGVAHAYRNVGDTDLKVVIVYTPGGVEESFQDWADESRRVEDILAGYGVTLVD